MKAQLFNTLGRKKEEITPLDGDTLGLYTCGPTVYNYAHIGNLRTYIFEDLLRRSLTALGYKVRHVMNITDVGHLTGDSDDGQDKMELGAAREGKSAWDIAKFYTEAFFQDHQALNCLRPDLVTKATDYVSKPGAKWDMIRLIQALEHKGFTYRTSDGIYFDTSKFPAYSRLAGAAHIEGLRGGARVEQSPEKKNVPDFALWKFSPAGEKRQMEWDSPWGRGFPGWHIECSAMSMDTLGETFDIHCGGVDHIAIHHSNEIAQAEAATGKPFVKVWLHGEFLVVGAKVKMAKSADNFLTLKRLAAEGAANALKAPYDPLAYRYFCLNAHYRSQLEFGWPAMDAAQKSLDALRTHYWRLQQEAGTPPADLPATVSAKAVLSYPPYRAFYEALADDLNLPKALAAVWQTVAWEAAEPGLRLILLKHFDTVLGLDVDALAKNPPPSKVLELVTQREAARKSKDFAASDKLRADIGALGYYVEDTPNGSRLVKK